jgi:hypothetical protein
MYELRELGIAGPTGPISHLMTRWEDEVKPGGSFGFSLFGPALAKSTSKAGASLGT